MTLNLYLPDFLTDPNPPAPEMVPMQVLLLTQEVAALRDQLRRLADGFEMLARMTAPASHDPADFDQ